MLGENQGDRATSFRIAARNSPVVFRDADIQPLSCRADVVAAIRTTQNVEIRTVGHGPPSSFETRSFGPLLRMRAGLTFTHVHKETRTPTDLILRSPPKPWR